MKELKENHDTFFTKLFNAEKEGKLSEILMFTEVKQVRASYPEYPYLDKVTDYVANKLNLTLEKEEWENLKSMCYFAGGDIDNDKEVAQEKEMIAQGFIPVREVGDYRGTAELVGKKSVDWMTNKIALTGKIITAGNGLAFFIPKGKRTRGYYLATIENGFFKKV